MCGRIGYYDISTATRELKIQWAKVELLRHGEHKLKKPTPPPFAQIKQESTGAIIGKEISLGGILAKAVAERIEKAQNAWGIVISRLLRNKASIPRIKIMLWNSIIRSTMIYGLHTKELPRNLINQLET